MHSSKHGFNPLTRGGSAETHPSITQWTAVSSVATVLTVAVNRPVSQLDHTNVSLMCVSSVTADVKVKGKVFPSTGLGGP
jgi:hypothetical protein